MIGIHRCFLCPDYIRHFIFAYALPQRKGYSATGWTQFLETGSVKSTVSLVLLSAFHRLLKI
jgi:hypothetical protein